MPSKTGPSPGYMLGTQLASWWLESNNCNIIEKLETNKQKIWFWQQFFFFRLLSAPLPSIAEIFIKLQENAFHGILPVLLVLTFDHLHFHLLHCGGWHQVNKPRRHWCITASLVTLYTQCLAPLFIHLMNMKCESRCSMTIWIITTSMFPIRIDSSFEYEKWTCEPM